MINVVDKKDCSGCSACVSICPRHALTMVSDEEGFQYPEINEDYCINCGLCEKVCPFKDEICTPELCYTYAAKHKDASVLKNSTSGGIFTAISDAVLSEGGVVYGAAFNDILEVCHMRADTLVGIERMRGSKYVQSNIGDTFKNVKKDLDAGRKVLFTGTPCQVAGLKHYIGKNNEQLICCDLICHGVPSPKVFQDHIKYISQKKKSRVVDYLFRPKKWGWHVHREIVVLENGKECYSDAYTDLWKSIYYSRVVTRKSCNNCPFSNMKRQGDITIGDCRGIEKVLPEFENFNGVSLVIVNSQCGKSLFEKVKKSLTFEAVDINGIIQPPLRAPSKENPASSRFFQDYCEGGYAFAIRQRYGRLYEMKYYIKKLLHR